MVYKVDPLTGLGMELKSKICSKFHVITFLIGVAGFEGISSAPIFVEGLRNPRYLREYPLRIAGGNLKEK